MRVVVVGGGIGGLACAQGLLRHGFDVRVVERDTDLAATGGYKLHLGVPAVAALRDLLPPTLVEALLASSVATRGFALTVRDHRGRRLLRAVDPAGGTTLDVDRVTLRRVLATGLGERLLTGRTARGWRAGRAGTADDPVTVEVDGGDDRPDPEPLGADLLVIADGAGSALAARLAGRPTSTPCGLVGVAGRTPWQDVPAAARALLTEPALAIGPGGTGLFLTAHDPVAHAAVRSPLADPATTSAVAIWGLLTVDRSLPPHPARLDPAVLLTLATRLLRRHGWAEPLVGLVAHGTPSGVGAFRLHAADPGDLAPWPAGRVTALGDAVHAMPPTGGQGAATAVLDARGLVDALRAVRRGDVTLPVAVHDHEAAMRVRGAAAVRESLQPVGWIRGTATPVGAAAVRAVTPVVALAAESLRRVGGRA